MSGRYGLIHNFASNLINYANVKYVIDYKKNIYGGISENGNLYQGVDEGFSEVFKEGRIGVYENTNVLPRVWSAKHVVVADSQTDLIYKLESLKPGDKSIVLESKPDIEPDLGAQVTINAYDQQLNGLSFETVANGNSLVFISQSFYPGWRAYVDGVETKLFRANYVFQSIAVPAGNHVVDLQFQPDDYELGKNTSYFTTFIILIFVGTYIVRVGKRKSESYT